MPSLESLYHKTIYNGYKNSFVDLGHEFRPFTANDSLEKLLETYQPNIFITASHFYYRKFINFKLLDEHRKNGVFVLSKINFWQSPISSLRINEAKSIKNDVKVLNLLEDGMLGDAFFHVAEQGDERMHGFSEFTGCTWHTIPLAADKISLDMQKDEKFSADISYVGSYLPEKRSFFKKHVFPLEREFNLRLYGQDWTRADRLAGWIQRAGQYFNINPLAKIRKPKLDLADEGKIYASSKVSINVHEEYQIRYGGDCNERTFKIPFCGGLQVVDNVSCIKKYFDPGTEVVIANNSEEWVDAVRYYVSHPEEGFRIIEAGRVRALRDHTYHNRVAQILDIYNESKRKF